MLEILYKGGPVMYLLLLCSVFSVTITIERIVFWIGIWTKKNDRVLNMILRLVEKGKINEALANCKKTKDHRVAILAEGIKNYKTNFTTALEAAGANEINLMKKYLVVLDTIITLSPLLGILGTVFGVIVSFGIIGQGTEIVDPTAVTGGIAQALITTAAGLIIAVFTLIPFNCFNSFTEENAQEIEKYVNALELAHSSDKNIEEI
ncbi:MAG: MotA/TolQ/ExbB proton channel family protein [Candidatus Omnitrophica bacterium]|nr:MotA/TolQ/ExbB proton channel family protein [Candidatus Omnitrophota bacterium]